MQNTLTTQAPKDLVHQTGALTAFQPLDEYDVVGGTEDLDRSDLQFPQLKLTQPTSKKIPDFLKHGGEWFNDLSQTFSNPALIVPVRLGKGRSCFPRDYNEDNEPLCRSDDSLQPRKEFIGITVVDPKLNIAHAIAETCEQCPLAQFGASNQAPMCSKSFTYYALDAATAQPFVVRFSRSAMAAAKRFNTLMQTDGRRKMILLGSMLKSDTKGTYFVPVILQGDFTPQELKIIASDLDTQIARTEREREVEVQMGEMTINGQPVKVVNSESEIPF